MGFFFESYLKTLTTEGMIALQSREPSVMPLPLLALTADGDDDMEGWVVV